MPRLDHENGRDDVVLFLHCFLARRIAVLVPILPALVHDR
jgi:hypothetical protein